MLGTVLPAVSLLFSGYSGPKEAPHLLMAHVDGVLSHVPRTHSGCAEGRIAEKAGMGTSGIAARPVPLQRDESLGMRELPLPWAQPCFLLDDSRKGHFQFLDVGVWVGAKAGWIWGKDCAGMLLLLPETNSPAFLGEKY